MSKNNVRISRGVVLILALVAAASASAITLEEFSAKNRELLTLKTDLEIVKKKQEIKKETDGKSDSVSAKAPSSTSMPMMGQLNQSMPVQPIFSNEQSGLALKSISGDVANPQVEFTYNGAELPEVTKGRTIVDGWRLVSVEGRTVVVERASSGKRKAESKTIYLAGASSSEGMSRYDGASVTAAQPQRSALSPTSSLPSLPAMPTSTPMPSGIGQMRR
jgi:hypothetical protein